MQEETKCIFIALQSDRRQVRQYSSDQYIEEMTAIVLLKVNTRQPGEEEKRKERKENVSPIYDL